MSASNYLEEKILKHIFGIASYTAPSWYVALSTTTPNDTGNVTEPSGGSYARQSIGNVSFASGAISNDNDITFPTATGSWGTLTHFALYDASSGGNMLAYGALTSAKTVTSGDAVKFSAGALTITLD